MKLTSRLLTGALLLAAPAVFAQTTTTVSGTASVTIMKALTLSQATGLVFGNIVADATTSGTAAINANGTVTNTTVKAAAGVPPSAATFNVAGTAGQTIAITVPPGNITLSGSGTAAGNSITASGFASSVSTIVLVSGANPFGVGASLAIAAAQVDGPYNGTFPVTVAYN
jgi:hypothetical protein